MQTKTFKTHTKYEVDSNRKTDGCQPDAEFEIPLAKTVPSGHFAVVEPGKLGKVVVEPSVKVVSLPGN